METEYEKIIAKIETIDPIRYGKTRNFLWGNVSQLSPYVSRGVISTKQILESLFKRGFKPHQLERLAQQLTWRDYFQRTAQRFPELSVQNIKNDPVHFQNKRIPTAILNANTQIDALDEGIDNLYNSGWIHNHMRMYLSMLHTNVARSDWRSGARWMYYYLFDADMASNDLSWQWVCGANSHKLYVANQENINKYTGSKQAQSYLDIEYEEFSQLPVPDALKTTEELHLISTESSINELKSIGFSIQTPNELLTNEKENIALYTWNNLDPNWHTDKNYRRLLLLDKDEFVKRPISQKTIEFVLELSQNIENLEVVYGAFSDLKTQLSDATFYFKEHPSQINWVGIEESRDWIFPEVAGYTSSFFGYWKKCEKYYKTF